MSSVRRLHRAAIGALACALLVASATSRAQSAAPDGEFIYEAQVGDTLIGVSQRLLLKPQRWPEVQARNRIANPRRIPVGTNIRIPYAWLRIAPETALVARVAGKVTSGARSVVEGESVAQGSRLETGEDGSVTLNLADGSVVTLQKSSALRFEEMERINTSKPAHGLRLKLESGRLETTVKPNRGVGRFEIVTPVAVSAVRGTHFRVGYGGGDARAITETLDGSVNVAGRTEVLVPAGFGTRVERDGSPVAPVPLLPAPNLSAIPPTNSTPQLRITLSPVAGAAAYHFQLSTDPDFRIVTADTVSTVPELSIDALPEGDYRLRARAIDALEIEGADAVAAFVQHVLPAPPVAATPQPSERVAGKQIAYAWTPIASAARYRLQVARDEAFADLVLDQESLEAAQLKVDGTAPGRYYWRVAALDGNGERGAWSKTRAFTQLADAPLPEPPTIEARQMRIRWAAVEGERYRVQVAQDAAFQHLVAAREITESELSMRKPTFGTYYVRVQLVDSAGSAGPFGPARRFDIRPPLWLEIVLPLLALAPLLG